MKNSTENNNTPSLAPKKLQSITWEWHLKLATWIACTLAISAVIYTVFNWNMSAINRLGAINHNLTRLFHHKTGMSF